MAKSPDWQEWEQHVQETLGLDSTPASGNQFNAPGDAVDNRHPSQSSFPLLVDCKYTEKLSFSLGLVNIKLWIRKGAERGKRAILAIRLQPLGMNPGDFVVLSLDDFAELLEKTRNWDESNRQWKDKQSQPSPDFSGWTDRTYLERDEHQGRGWSGGLR